MDVPLQRNILHETEHPKPLQCPTCEKRYACKRTWQRHVHYECGGQKHYNCHLCSAKYRQSGGLQRHLKNFHKVAVSLRNSCNRKSIARKSHFHVD